MEETALNEFLRCSGLDYDKIHHAEIIYASPEYWYYIKHHKGDEMHSEFYNLFHFELPWHKKKFYTSSIVAHKFENYEKPIIEAVSDFTPSLKKGKYIWNEEDKKHPVWYANGLRVYDVDKYGNIDSCIHEFHINWYSLEECEEIVEYINDNYSKKYSKK